MRLSHIYVNMLAIKSETDRYILSILSFSYLFIYYFINLPLLSFIVCLSFDL